MYIILLSFPISKRDTAAKVIVSTSNFLSKRLRTFPLSAVQHFCRFSGAFNDTDDDHNDSAVKCNS